MKGMLQLNVSIKIEGNLREKPPETPLPRQMRRDSPRKPSEINRKSRGENKNKKKHLRLLQKKKKIPRGGKSVGE